MGTQRWENLPVYPRRAMDVLADPPRLFQPDEQHPCLGQQEQMLEALAESRRGPIDPRDAALEDLRQQLTETREERDRYIARCRVLEATLDEVRRVVR